MSKTEWKSGTEQIIKPQLTRVAGEKGDKLLPIQFQTEGPCWNNKT